MRRVFQNGPFDRFGPAWPVSLVVVLAASAVMLLPRPADAASNGASAATGAFTVLSDTMEADRTGGTVVFRGDVAASEDFLVCSDELTVSYGKEREIIDITATGGVRLYHGTVRGSSESAVYMRRDRKMVLSGRAEVVQCSDRLSGERITVDLETDRAVVEGASSDSRVKAVIAPDKACAGGAAEGKGLEKPAGERTRCQWPR